MSMDRAHGAPVYRSTDLIKYPLLNSSSMVQIKWTKGHAWDLITGVENKMVVWDFM
jgi:hypothetical protein